jgi:hypothetical protein
MELIGCVGGRGILLGPLARAPHRLLALQSARGLVLGVVRGSALMRPGRSSSRSLRAQRLTVLVPEGCAEGIRQFARNSAPGTQNQRIRRTNGEPSVNGQSRM